MMPEPGHIDVIEIEDRLADIRERIAAACARAGRSSNEVTLVSVTKTFPIEVISAAMEAGLDEFGENKVQELVPKAQAIPGHQNGGRVTWHAIGHLQRNKAKEVVRYADLFHALDSVRLAQELDARAAQAGRILPCLIQVNVSGEESKFGVDPIAVEPLLNELVGFEHLSIRGLMTLASPADDPEEVRPQFRLLRQLAERLRAENKADLQILSMGMSGDFEVAIEEGATHVRIGSALFGSRS